MGLEAKSLLALLEAGEFNYPGLLLFMAVFGLMAATLLSRSEVGLMIKVVVAGAALILGAFAFALLYEAAEGDPRQMMVLAGSAMMAAVTSIFQMPEPAEPISNPALAMLYRLIPFIVVVVLCAILAVMRIMLRRMREAPPE